MFIEIKGEKFYRPGIDEKLKKKIEEIRKEFNKPMPKNKRDKKLPHFT